MRIWPAGTCVGALVPYGVVLTDDRSGFRLADVGAAWYHESGKKYDAGA